MANPNPTPPQFPPPANQNGWNLIGSLLTSLTESVAALAGYLQNSSTAIDKAAGAMEKAAVATTTASTALTATVKPKPKTKPDAPDPYTGDPENAQAFMDELTFYFKHIEETNALNQISFALSKIRGGTINVASTWSNGICVELIIADANGVNPYPDFPTFKAAFLEHFQLRDSSGDAIEAIRTLIMGDRTCEEFNTLFKTYQARSGYNDVALVEEYKRALTAGLRSRCYQSFPLPTTLAEWMTRAATLDKQYRLDRAFKGTLPSKSKATTTSTTNIPARSSFTPRPTTNTFTPRNTPAPTFTKKDPDAMDIDATRQEERKKGLCFYCKEPGHIAMNCPKKKTPRYTTRAIKIEEMSEEERALLQQQLQDFQKGRE